MRVNLHLRKPDDSYLGSTQTSEKCAESENSSSFTLEKGYKITMAKTKSNFRHKKNLLNKSVNHLVVPNYTSITSPHKSEITQEITNRSSYGLSLCSENESGIISRNHSPITSRSASLVSREVDLDDLRPQNLNNSEFLEISLHSRRESLMIIPKRIKGSCYSSDKVLTTDCNSFMYQDQDSGLREKYEFQYELQTMKNLGVMPCTAFCNNCKIDVHTEIRFIGSALERKMLSLISEVFTCCEGPAWLSKKRAHTCPNCRKIISI